MIPFNKPVVTGNEIDFIKEVIESKKLSGDGVFTKKCESFFETKYNFKKALLTSSCTDALEMCALLCNIEPDDEVIAPSYTFVSTVNAFVLRGAVIKFVDSQFNNPNIDTCLIEPLITKKTKAIICVHYAGISCNMEDLVRISKQHNLFLIEDVAQALDGYYNQKPLGSFGDFGVFSFHETKNITCGEGGLLIINNESFVKRAEILRDKGTNRREFINGEVDKYGWVDIGSSFSPSEITAAFLWAQLQQINQIQLTRLNHWNLYYNNLAHLKDKIMLPNNPIYSTHTAHSFYIICKTHAERTQLIEFLKAKHITAAFHHISLHNSNYYKNKHDNRELPQADLYSNNLVRLPLYYDLMSAEINEVCNAIELFYKA